VRDGLPFVSCSRLSRLAVFRMCVALLVAVLRGVRCLVAIVEYMNVTASSLHAVDSPIDPTSLY
jgi:hypothetical protein